MSVREIFSLFAPQGIMEIEKLGDVLQCLGQYPTETELQDMMSEVDADGVSLVARKMPDIDAEEWRIEAFQDSDRHGGGFSHDAESVRLREENGELQPRVTNLKEALTTALPFIISLQSQLLALQAKAAGRKWESFVCFGFPLLRGFVLVNIASWSFGLSKLC